MCTSEIIGNPGLINLDFANVWSIISDAGMALMGIIIGSRKNGGRGAATAAVSSHNAKRVVLNILSLTYVNMVAWLIYDSMAKWTSVN